MIFGIHPSGTHSSTHAASAPDKGRMETDAGGDARHADGNYFVVCSGRPLFRGAAAAVARERGNAAAWLESYRQNALDCPNQVGGSFAVAIHDAANESLYLAIDRFSVVPLCHGSNGKRLAFAERADRVAQLLDGADKIDPQAIFDYLHFHVIPGPRTIYAQVSRLLPGHYLLARHGAITTAPWWRPRFFENERRPFADLRDEFLELLRQSVAAQAETGAACFLSGGTDSSTVAGLIGAVTGAPAHTYSIGFDAEGYDEMEYARLAARHFKTVHHEYYVTADDLVRSIPDVAASYDQPFGNSSALPGYYCARVAAADGHRRILAGDGGDELFGGNARYAKQRLFEAYGAVPEMVRQRLVEPLFDGFPRIAQLPGLSKFASYVQQARVPMPDRLQMYNLLQRLGAQQVFEPDFLAAIDRQEPARMERGIYYSSDAASIVNRMLAYDWKFTLADSDLPKVVGTTALAGIEVAFPLLDDRLVDFSLRLAPAMKVRGLRLRWFFKRALRDFLPQAIIAKKKHGFGLPFGLWATRHPALRALAYESLQNLKRRGIVRVQFIDDLLQRRLIEHPGYYGEMVWILMMLEQWMAARKVPIPRAHHDDRLTRRATEPLLHA
jgi:asparagine synthase (glutamine-hydrolysing)